MNDKQIEITPEMLEAGAAALEVSAGDYEDGLASGADVVSDIYRAMETARQGHETR